MPKQEVEPRKKNSRGRVSSVGEAGILRNHENQINNEGKCLMTRVTRGFVAKKRRKKVLKLASGFTGANNRLYRTAQQRTLRALATAYRDRRLMKRTIRSVWIRRINCFLKDYAVAKSKSTSPNPTSHEVSKAVRLSYSIFTSKLKTLNILLNRKILSQLSIFDPNSMQNIINRIESTSHSASPNQVK